MCVNCDTAVKLIEMTREGGVVEIRLNTGKEPVLIRDGVRYVLRNKDEASETEMQP